MIKRNRTVMLLALCLCLASALGAQTLKIASLAPENSDYGKVLNRINAEWIKISGGKVKLMIIHNGAAGGEDEVLRKMRQGTLQGGMFTSSGLARLSPVVITLSAPLLIKTNNELKHVLANMKPELDASLAALDLVPVAYARGGWVYTFSKTSFKVPADLKSRKFASNDGDKATFSTLQNLGYRPISLPLTDYLVSLNSNLVDTIMVSPVAALQFQWFGVARYMLDLPMAPFLGTVVIEQKAWKRVPEELKPKLLEAAAAIVNRELEPAVEKLETGSIDTMKANGLSVIPVDNAVRTAWNEEFSRGVESMFDSGGYDRRTYDRVKALLAGYKE